MFCNECQAAQEIVQRGLTDAWSHISTSGVLVAICEQLRKERRLEWLVLPKGLWNLEGRLTILQPLACLHGCLATL